MENKKHEGECCYSCIMEKDLGLGQDIYGCCCKDTSLEEDTTPMQETKQKEIRDWKERFRNEFVKLPTDWRETGWTVPFVDSRADKLEQFISTLLQEEREKTKKFVEENINSRITQGDDLSTLSKEINEMLEDIKDDIINQLENK